MCVYYCATCYILRFISQMQCCFLPRFHCMYCVDLAENALFKNFGDLQVTAAILAP